MNYANFSKIIITLKNNDLRIREELIQKGVLGDGYNKEMEALHTTNAKELNSIINKIGYPTISKVGKEANEAAWLIIQHSISNPAFMKMCKKKLAIAVEAKEANPINLAYLVDRIASYENRPQQYGTQFDWDENGQLSSNHYDDLEKVNQRRKQLGLNTLEEQTKIIRARAKKENELPPSNYEERKKEIEKWKLKVGWLQ